MKRNTPLFFKKTPTQNATPNATFLRDMGLLNLEPVCEIEYDGHPWIVRYEEILDANEAMQVTATRMLQEIEAAKKATGKENPCKAHIALKLGIDPRTLNKRLKFIEDNFTPPEKPPGPNPPALEPPAPDSSTAPRA